MKREKEEKLTKSLSLFEMEKEEDKYQETLSDHEQKGPPLHFPNLENVKNVLKLIDETLQNLRVWKKAEKLDFERQIHENEQTILMSNQHENEYDDNLEKYIKEMEEIQKQCTIQIDIYAEKFNKEEMGSISIIKESEESFKKIKEANQKLETLICKHQMSYGQSLENDVQRQFFQNAIESLNLEKLTKRLDKWQDNIEEFYNRKENHNEETIDLKNMDKIKLEQNKVQEKAIEDSKMSEKIKNDMDEIDKELEELEKMLA